MKDELDKALSQRYPLIFKRRNGDPLPEDFCWGIGGGDGWYDLIDAMCGLICWPYEQARESYERARSREGQVERNGEVYYTAVAVERARLKMKTELEEIPVAVQVKEKYGTLRFYVDGGGPRAHLHIEFAEYMSGRICDVCGAPGKQRGGGWVRTLCEKHHEERNSGNKRAEPRKPRNVRLFTLPGDLPLSFIVGESIEHLHNRDLSALVRPLVQRFNAEDAKSETGHCDDGRTVEDNLVDAMQALGFIKPVTVVSPFHWDVNLEPEGDASKGD